MTSSEPGRSEAREAEAEFCGVDPRRDQELERQGWQRRFVAQEPRLSEAVSEYEELGFEIHLEPFDPQAKGEGGCTVCFENPQAAAQFKTIYTRPGRGGEDDLF